jgi:glyoxylase-like metal-dependent hydrolase (beta-lactamase superfamily II)/dienelactone hydrolase
MNSRRIDMAATVLFLFLAYPTLAQGQSGAAFQPPADVEWRQRDVMSEGTRLTAELFSLKTQAGKKLPTIIMCHGWGGVAANLRQDAIAFARAGYLVVTFDYRGWGASDARVILTKPAPRDRQGTRFTAEVEEVREVVDPLDQTTDLLNVVHWVHGESQCDPARIGLWGSSYSGSHVVYAAARDARVKATVSQVPALDSRWVLQTPKEKDLTYKEATERARGEIGYPKPGARVIGNLRGAPLREKLMNYAPVEDADKAPGCAMLFILAEKEELFDNKDHGVKAYDRTRGPKKLVVIPKITHYGVYTVARPQAQKLAIEWYDQHLKGVDNDTPARPASPPPGSGEKKKPPEATLREPFFDNPRDLFRFGEDQEKALQVHERIFQAIGFGNTFLVVTKEGNVVVDTSLFTHALRHHKLLQAVNAGPVRYIILTHGHGDHTGGIGVWKEKDTQIVAQKQHVEFLHYQKRLEDFFALRNAAQFARPRPKSKPWPGNYGARIEPTILFDDKYEFELGGIQFHVLHTPGETPDHATVWIPQYKAVFVGDNFYRSFPNLYTLRGSQPRWALDYVQSLNKVLALKPEIMLPSHGLPVHGNAEITRQLNRYRDAIQYVHDAVVHGMNDGKDVFSLMREVKLPRELDVGEGYGRLSWSVRGIYEGYAGWFDLSPATMYATPASSVYSEVVKQVGGPDAVVRLAQQRLQAGQAVEALHLTDMALTAEPGNRIALEARLKALDALQARCRNSIERGWLEYSIDGIRDKLKQPGQTRQGD